MTPLQIDPPEKSNFKKRSLIRVKLFLQNYQNRSFFFENFKRKQPVPHLSKNVCEPPQYKYMVIMNQKLDSAKK